MNSKNIPFYPNLKDDLHCLQACLKMVLKFYFPKKNYSYSELDKISRHVKGKWTWQGSSLLELSKLGFEVVNIENLNYIKFSQTGEEYLQKIWSPEVFESQKKFSNLKQEQQVAKKLIKDKKIKLINRQAQIGDIEYYFSNNFTVLVSLNPCVLQKQDCYASHIVVVTGVDSQGVAFHDPGLPAQKNKKVSKKLFEKSMTPPRKEDTNIIAIKLRKR